jgi:hypothetical protein
LALLPLAVLIAKASSAAFFAVLPHQLVSAATKEKKGLLFTLPRHLCLNLGPFRKLSIGLSSIPALIKVLFLDRVEH